MNEIKTEFGVIEMHPDPVTKGIRDRIKLLTEVVKEYSSAHDIPLYRLGMHAHTVKQLHARGFTHMYNFVERDPILFMRLKRELTERAFADLVLTIEALKQAYRNQL